MSKGFSPRFALLLIAALFIGPLVVAWLMYAGVIDYRPGTTRNLGQLVEPPMPVDWSGVATDAGEPVDAETFGRHWLILHAVPADCGEDCLAAVTGIRQVHRATGRYQSRIRLALLQAERDDALSGQLHDVYASFDVLRDPAGGLLAALQSAAGGGSTEGATYLVDPLGNIMMYYPGGFDPNDLRKDLKRLLTWSKLDEQQ